MASSGASALGLGFRVALKPDRSQRFLWMLSFKYVLESTRSETNRPKPFCLVG